MHLSQPPSLLSSAESLYPKSSAQAESDEEEEEGGSTARRGCAAGAEGTGWTSSQLLQCLCYSWEKNSENTTSGSDRRGRTMVLKPRQEQLGEQQHCTKLRGRTVFWSELMPEYTQTCA